MGDYLAREERLRRIGNFLLKGVNLWAAAVEAAGAQGAPEPRRGANANVPLAVRPPDGRGRGTLPLWT